MAIPIPSLSSASADQTTSAARTDRSGSTIFNIGGNPNVSPLAQSAESVLTSPYLLLAVVVVAGAYFIGRK